MVVYRFKSRYQNTFDYQEHFSFEDGGISIGNGRSSKQARERFAHKTIVSLFYVFRVPSKVPVRFEIFIFWYQRRGEMELVRNTMDVTEEQLSQWNIGNDRELNVTDDELISSRIQIRADFLYIRHTYATKAQSKN